MFQSQRKLLLDIVCEMQMLCKPLFHSLSEKQDKKKKKRTIHLVLVQYLYMKQSFSVVQAGVDPSILLPQPAKGWHYEHKPSGPALKAIFKRRFLSHGWLTPLTQRKLIQNSSLTWECVGFRCGTSSSAQCLICLSKQFQNNDVLMCCVIKAIQSLLMTVNP